MVYRGVGVGGLTNQLLYATQGLLAACHAKANFAGHYEPHGENGEAHRDLVELFDLPTLQRRLRGGLPAGLAHGCTANNSDGVDVRSVHCASTDVVPLSCVPPSAILAATGPGNPAAPAPAATWWWPRFSDVLRQPWRQPVQSLLQRARRDTPAAVPAVAWAMRPKRVHLLYALEPSRQLAWHGSSCRFDAARHAYHAIHFNADADWLLWLCSSLHRYGSFVGGGWGGRGWGLEEQEALLGPAGIYAGFVRTQVIPSYVRTMRVAFRGAPSRPVVVCSSLGKLWNVTTWIVRAEAPSSISIEH